mmetsp:Transcript_45237/g.147008  ORF Transcript_45237/g.147008 Transcript_45237/m.147008 type:complete len:237 (+) Transcript_45237:190-900(+)
MSAASRLSLSHPQTHRLPAAGAAAAAAAALAATAAAATAAAAAGFTASFQRKELPSRVGLGDDAHRRARVCRRYDVKVSIEGCARRSEARSELLDLGRCALGWTHDALPTGDRAALAAAEKGELFLHGLQLAHHVVDEELSNSRSLSACSRRHSSSFRGKHCRMSSRVSSFGYTSDFSYSAAASRNRLPMTRRSEVNVKGGPSNRPSKAVQFVSGRSIAAVDSARNSRCSTNGTSK